MVTLPEFVQTSLPHPVPARTFPTGTSGRNQSAGTAFRRTAAATPLSAKTATLPGSSIGSDEGTSPSAKARSTACATAGWMM